MKSTLTQKELSSVSGYSARALRMIKLPRDSQGKYPAEEAIRALFNHARKAGPGTDEVKQKKLAEERLRKTSAEADDREYAARIKAQALAEREENMRPFAELLDAGNLVLETLNNQLEHFAVNVSLAANPKDPFTAEKAIQSYVGKIRMEMDRVRERLEALEHEA